MTHSIWQEFPIPSFPELDKSCECEICVVGSGISGVTAAYLLTKAGRRVTLITAGEFLRGESAKTSAQINTIHDDSWQEMERVHGLEKMREVAESYRVAFNFIRSTVTSERIDCDYRNLPGYLFAGAGSGGEDWIRDELESARRIGVEGVSTVPRVPLPEYDSGTALRYENQAEFHPIAYITALTDRALKTGLLQIFTEARVTNVSSDSGRVLLELEQGRKVQCAHAILATNVPFHHRLIPIEATEAYRSYIITVPLNEELPIAQYWDNCDPYHYVRLVPKGGKSQTNGSRPQLLVGGEDRRVGDVRDEFGRYEDLLSWAADRFPIVPMIDQYWSAQTIETFDGMPLLGPCPGDDENIFAISGDSGTGLTHGTLGAMIAADRILGIVNPFRDLFLPGRARTKSLRKWIGQNLGGAASYAEWLTPGDLSTIDSLPLGEGGIIRHGAHKLAVYRDLAGEFHTFSATCPHLGSIIQWNPVEKSWDCPAHGSRFTCMGAVLNGPAACGLSCSETKEAQPGETSEPSEPERTGIIR